VTGERRHPGADGLDLRLHVLGSGPPLLCLPGGPGNSAAYLEDLGGLDATHTLLLLDPRGTGGSAPRERPGSFGVDDLVADLEAVRMAEGLERVRVLAHSAGGRIALEWAARHPQRVEALVLVTSVAQWDDAVGAERRAVAALRRDEPWYAEAAEAGMALAYAPASERRRLEALSRPFWYARWDERAQAHSRHVSSTVNLRAALQLRSELRVRPLPRLDAVRVPVLLVVGQLDTAAPAAAVARLERRLPSAELVVVAGASHFPWVDQRDGFRGVVSEFLQRTGPMATQERSSA
jgi:proline iminopeptidase